MAGVGPEAGPVSARRAGGVVKTRYGLLVVRGHNMFGIPAVTGVAVIRTADEGRTWEPYCNPIACDEAEGQRIVDALNAAVDHEVAVAALRSDLESGLS
jgi:hypothetical protein